jgi:nucleotide-binding universal stress UspA family protein
MTMRGAETVAFACRLACGHGSTLAVAHARTKSKEDHYADWHDFERAFFVLAETVRKSDLAVHEIVLEETSPDAIINLAIVRDADLLIVEAQHRLFDWPSVGGKLTGLLAAAPCPVMTVPQRSKRKQ